MGIKTTSASTGFGRPDFTITYGHLWYYVEVCVRVCVTWCAIV